MTSDNPYAVIKEMQEMLDYLREEWGQIRIQTPARRTAIAQAYGTLVLAIVDLDRKTMENLNRG